jgi:hypothetical protein
VQKGIAPLFGIYRFDQGKNQHIIDFWKSRKRKNRKILFPLLKIFEFL